MATKVNPHVSVDCVIFSYDLENLKVLLVERTYTTRHLLGLGKRVTDWKLPGDLVRDDEELDTSAKRIIKENIGLENIFLEKFSSFGDLNRIEKKNDKEWLRSKRDQPNARVVTITYVALVKPGAHATKPASPNIVSQWCPMNEIPELAFDHNHIVEEALRTLRNKLKDSIIVFELLPEEFTLIQAQKLYEAVSGSVLDKRNFRRKINNLDLLIPLNKKEKNAVRRPAALYKLNADAFKVEKDVF